MKVTVLAERILGIDLGTSNSCVASFTGSKAEIIRNALGDSLTPSVVAFAADDSLIVGAPAHRQAIMNPSSTFFEVKRLCGRRFDDEEIQIARKILPYDIVKATNGDAWVAHKGRPMSPPEVQSLILESLRKNAESFWNEEITKAVITVPAFFDETQRQAVRDAATIAGMQAVRILSEPTAAAVAYGHAQFDGRVVVVDFGGGTLDVTLMDVRDGQFKVLATDGDNMLGGADFDQAIAGHLAKIVQKESGMDPLEDVVARQRLVSEAEQIKKQLTTLPSVQVKMQYLLESQSGPVNLETSVSRADLESLVAPLIERIAKPCSTVMGRIGLRAADIDDVLLVGGMSRSPIVQKKISSIFQRKPSQRINPDEAIAIGAAIAAAGLSGDLPEAKLVDVAPRSIGLAASKGEFVPLIKASQALPAIAKKRFATTQDNQKSFSLVILQGESRKASENRRLARVSIEPIPQAPKGEVTLDVEFSMNENGELLVSANSEGTELSAPIQPLSGLTRSQVEKLAVERKRARGDHSNGGGASAKASPGDAELLGNFSVDFSSSHSPSAENDDASKPLMEFGSGGSLNEPALSTESIGGQSSVVENASDARLSRLPLALGMGGVLLALAVAAFFFLS